MRDEEDRTLSQQETTGFVIYVLATLLSSTVTLFATVFMLLGTGLASTPESPVPQASAILWGIAAFSLVPTTILLVMLVATQRRSVATVLAAMVAGAGIASGVAWFINSNGAMPGNTAGNITVIAVFAIPILCGALMMWRSKALAE